MDYIELIFPVLSKVDADILIARLAEQGFESFVETDKGLNAYIPKAKFSEQLISFINLDKIENTIVYEKKIIESKNWNSVWEDSFQPILISNLCCVRAPFHDLPKDVKYDIIIEPKMSFGTGHHETTALMIENMLQLDMTNEKVLDMGCGTGILAILASMMGAHSVTAVDIDRWAYQNSLENIEKNAIGNIEVYQADKSFLEEKIFNLILANINKNVLLSDIASYSNVLTENGQLLLSGFFETDTIAIIEEATAQKFELKNKCLKNNWALLHFVKK